MSKLLPLLSYCLLLLANSATAASGQQRTSLEDIERDLSPKLPSYIPKVSTPAVASPTKFGFVPQRSASSYAATKPKYLYTQANYQVKRPQQLHYKNSAPPRQYINQQHYLSQQQQPQQTIEYVSQQQPGQYQQPQQTVQYLSQHQPEQYLSQQQYLTQQQPDQYTSQQAAATGHQPSEYDQYENVQYVTDNSITGQQPQYYFVQQYQAPSSSVESVVDPKGFQYLYVPSYVSNSIPNDKSVTNSVAKYVSKGTGDYYNSNRYSQPEESLVRRQPKSLLDSYVPSRVQLQYLMQQGKY